MGFHSIEDVLTWQGSPAAKAVLVAMAFRNNDQTNRCDPSIPGLAEMTCLSERTVMRAIEELEESAAIVAIRRPGARSIYQLKRCHPVTSDTVSPVTNLQKPVTTTTRTRDKSAKTSDTVSPEQKNRKEKENTAAPSPFRGEARRLLGAMTTESKPAFADQDYLREAADGNAKAWQSFQGSINTQTRRFIERHLASYAAQEQETA